jgi:GNAT superfamily N-acetyltransferase
MLKNFVSRCKYGSDVCWGLVITEDDIVRFVGAFLNELPINTDMDTYADIRGLKGADYLTLPTSFSATPRDIMGDMKLVDKFPLHYALWLANRICRSAMYGKRFEFSKTLCLHLMDDIPLRQVVATYRHGMDTAAVGRWMKRTSGVIDNEYLCIRKACIDDLDSVLNVQNSAINGLEFVDFLRRNTADMLRKCLAEPHYTVCAYTPENEVIAFCILFIPGAEGEALAPSLKSIYGFNYVNANTKLCVVSPEFRGNGLTIKMVKLLEDYAKSKGIGLLCATVHPMNEPSVEKLKALGYIYDSSTIKFNLPRDLYYHLI